MATWTITNAGLNAARDAQLGVPGAGIAITYFAVGTGTQGSPATATQLANEVLRKPITSAVNGASPGEGVITGYISPTDIPGTAITEVAFFGGPNASATANTGTMFYYGLYSHTHTATESINVPDDFTF